MQSRWLSLLFSILIFSSPIAAQKQVTIDRTKLEHDRKTKRTSKTTRSSPITHHPSPTSSSTTPSSSSHSSFGVTRSQKPTTPPPPRPASYLRVDNIYATHVSRDIGASSAYETFYVNTDGSSWDVTWMPHWCTLSNRSATSFSVYINENKTDNARQDWFIVKSGDKEVKVYINQNARQLNITASANNLGIIHNVYADDKNYMIILGDFIVTSGSELPFYAIATIKSEYGYNIYASPSYPDYKARDGSFMASVETTREDNSDIHKFKIVIPNNAFNPGYKKTNNLRITVSLYSTKKGEYISGASRTISFVAKKTKHGNITKGR